MLVQAGLPSWTGTFYIQSVSFGVGGSMVWGGCLWSIIVGHACEEACYVVDAWVHTVCGNDTGCTTQYDGIFLLGDNANFTHL